MIRSYVNVSENNIPDEEKTLKPIREPDMASSKLSNKKRFYSQIDIKGSVLLAITIVCFLLSLTYIQTPSAEDQTLDMLEESTFNYDSSFNQITPFLIIGTVALLLFIFQERRSQNPLIDFQIFLKPPILLSNMIIMIVGLSMFMIFQTIPILVQTPQPIGFGENAIST